jgi:hypothetical protein
LHYIPHFLHKCKKGKPSEKEFALIEKTIQENMDLLTNIKKTIGYQSDNAEDDIKLIKQIHWLKKETKESDEYLNLSALYSAYTILRIINNLDLSIITDMEPLLWFYYIGRSIGSSEASGGIEQIEESIHRKYSGKYTKERWKLHKVERNKLKAEIRKVAEKEYKNGRKDLHHNFANKLKARPQFKDIPIAVIRKEVGSVAEKYGKKYGVKKKI